MTYEDPNVASGLSSSTWWEPNTAHRPWNRLQKAEQNTNKCPLIFWRLEFKAHKFDVMLPSTPCHSAVGRGKWNNGNDNKKHQSLSTSEPGGFTNREKGLLPLVSSDLTRYGCLRTCFLEGKELHSEAQKIDRCKRVIFHVVLTLCREPGSLLEAHKFFSAILAFPRNIRKVNNTINNRRSRVTTI